MSSGLYNTHKIDFDTTLDLTRLKPYGDTMNDGKVQTSFTLPIKDESVVRRLPARSPRRSRIPSIIPARSRSTSSARAAPSSTRSKIRTKRSPLCSYSGLLFCL